MGSYDNTLKLKPGLYLYTYVDSRTGEKVYVVHDDIGALEFQTSSLLLLEKWYGATESEQSQAMSRVS
jgi:hypothetical protein